MNVGVHTSHCCAEHGCKYGNAECPVVLGTHEQEYPCEDCDIEANEMKERAAFLAKHPKKLMELLDAILKIPDGHTVSRDGARLGLAGMVTASDGEQKNGQ